MVKSFVSGLFHQFMAVRLRAEMPDFADAVVAHFVMTGSGDQQENTAATQSRAVVGRQTTKHGRQEAPAKLGAALLRSFSAWAC